MPVLFKMPKYFQMKEIIKQAVIWKISNDPDLAEMVHLKK